MPDTKNSYNSPTTKPLFRATQVVWYLFGLLEILLIFRLGLRFLGADQGAGFTSFISGVTWPFVAPFFAVFRTTLVEGQAFEWTTLLAMVVYLLIAWGLSSLFMMSRTISTPQAAQKLENEEAT